MSFDLFNYSINIVGHKTDKINYGMTCAWAMQVDYEKIVLLIGSQSVTGKVLKKGSIIGVSSLNKNQREIATKFALGHSDEVDKYEGVSYSLVNEAILIDDASVQMVVTIKEIIHLPDITDDILIYGQVDSSKKNGLPYLMTEDYNK